MKDDFETRSRYVASSELEFVNSWKESPLCGDVSFVADPCSLNAFRRSWAERKCSIINSQTFAACHSKVGTGQRAVRLLLHKCPVGVGEGVGAGPCLAPGGKARHGSPSMGSQTSQIRVQRGSDPLPERRALTWGRLVHCGCLAAPSLWPPDANSTPRQCHESPGAAWPGGAPCSGAGGQGDLQDAGHALPGPGCDPVIGVQ